MDLIHIVMSHPNQNKRFSIVCESEYTINYNKTEYFQRSFLISLNYLIKKRILNITYFS